MDSTSPHNTALKQNLSSCIIYSNENLSPPRNSSLRIFTAKKTDAYTATYKNVALHSAYDPVSEASHISHFVQTQSFDCIILVGTGLGYTVVELTKCYKDIPILCIEYDAMLFTSIFNIWQYPLLDTQNPYIFFVQVKPKDISEYLRERGLRNPCIVQTHIAKQFFTQKDKEALMEEIANYKKCIQVNDNTLQQFSRLWQKNIIRNATRNTSRIVSLSQLENVYNGIPALLCCAGPSLYQYLKHIQKLKSDMLLVAVDTAVGVLAKHKIIPDFICSVDPQYINTQHLQWNTSHTAHYIIDLAISPRLFQLATTQSIFFASKPIIPLAQAMYRNMNFEAEIHSGGSVATFAWDALRYMGITDIYTVGLDLSYPLHASHSRGCIFENASHMTSTRVNSAETKLHRMLCAAPLVATTSYKNTAVLSDKQLMVYYQWFQTMHEKFPFMKTYTFCEDGAHIPSVEYREADAIVQSMRNTVAHTKNTIQAMLTKDAFRLQQSAHKNLQEAEENAQHLYKELASFRILSQQAANIAYKALRTHISATEQMRLQAIERDIHANNLARCLSATPSVSEVIEFFVQKDIEDILMHKNADKSSTAYEKTYQLYNALYNCALSLETSLCENLNTVKEKHTCSNSLI